LQQFYQEPNVRIGALLSTGKDGLYAAYVMKQRNYEICCFMTMLSKNADSYMFHTPLIDIATYQAEAAEIPLLTQETMGEKEKELDDLKALLIKAKKEYNISGVVTGALFSTYQRDRIEKVCDDLELTVWNPLWHKDQQSYMYELLDQGFEFVMSKVMAEGLDSSWVGNVVKKEDVGRLVALNKKAGMNIAGEGGEFETLVLDCPLFKKKLLLKKTEIIHDKDREETASLSITSCALVRK
jgi:asparagine synthase (glutamine-hydrolysing)